MIAATATNGKIWQRNLRLALVLSMLVFDPALLARAQTTGSTMTPVPLRISAPQSVTLSAGAPVPLPIAVSPLDAMPANAFVRIKGLPQGAALTEGYAVAPGTWAVAINALAGLRAQVPAMPGWRGETNVQLVSVEGTVLAETQMALVYAAENPASIQPAAQPPPPAPRASVAAPPGPPKLSAEEQQKAERLVTQGDKFLDSGNVSVARQYFQRAADAGWAAGAMKLAATYDPVELERIAAQGVVAQPAEAKRWYERALALGAREAKERLARLASTN